MKRGMTRAARAELADAIRDRYAAAVGQDKRKILHEFIAATVTLLPDASPIRSANRSASSRTTFMPIHFW
jgi:hypothetical protein